jgi:type I restriction enzyme S subunit
MYRSRRSGEQRRIVAAIESYISRLDEAEAALERVQRNLKRYRAAVLQAAVEGRLVPTEADLARAEGRDYEPASELLKRILGERRRRWEEAELARLKAIDKAPKHNEWKAKYPEPLPTNTRDLPELPKGWCWATVDQLSQGVTYGSSAKARDRADGAVPVLRMGNILDGELGCERLKYLPASHPEFPGLFLQPGDVLFNRTNSAELVGKSAVYVGSPSPCSFASYLMRVRFLSGVSSEYIAAYLNSPAGRHWAASVAVQQVGQANVNGTKLKACPIPLAPEAEQGRIKAEMARLFSVAKAVARSTTRGERRSSHLRRSILKRAFEGKLVDQDPSDEPASSLLERIDAERASAQGQTRGGRSRGRQTTRR